MNWEDAPLEDVKRGYGYEEAQGYYCLVCDAVFAEGEVYPMAGRYFTGEKAAQQHMNSEHPDYLDSRIASDSKYNTLTGNQQKLLRMFARGLSDKEIAQAQGLSVSTIRHQRFSFREKAKQAKWYLALYESVFARKTQTGEEIMPVHEKANMVDERFVITEEERAHVLRTSFASLDPLVLRNFSPREKKKIIILTRIAEVFESEKEYTEKEVNALLEPIYPDFATVRRYLVEYGYMQRTRNGSKYWKN